MMVSGSLPWWCATRGRSYVVDAVAWGGATDSVARERTLLGVSREHLARVLRVARCLGSGNRSGNQAWQTRPSRATRPGHAARDSISNQPLRAKGSTCRTVRVGFDSRRRLSLALTVVLRIASAAWASACLRCCLIAASGGRADARASRRDLQRAIGVCGTVWCRRRAGRTPDERNAATGRVRARRAPRRGVGPAPQPTTCRSRPAVAAARPRSQRARPVRCCRRRAH